DQPQNLGIFSTELRVHAMKFTPGQCPFKILSDGLRGTDVVVNLLTGVQHEMFREYFQFRSCGASRTSARQRQHRKEQETRYGKAREQPWTFLRTGQDENSEVRYMKSEER